MKEVFTSIGCTSERLYMDSEDDDYKVELNNFLNDGKTKPRIVFIQSHGGPNTDDNDKLVLHK